MILKLKQLLAFCFFAVQLSQGKESSSHQLSKRETQKGCPEDHIIDLNGKCVKKFKIPKRKQCPPPEVSKFGSYELRSGGRFATFYCEDGWTLAPDNEHAMCKVGVWDRVIPNCVRPGCQRLATEEGVRMQRLLSGALAEFTCYQTHMVLVGPPVLGCDGEFWNGTAPVCREPPPATTPPPAADVQHTTEATGPPATQYRVETSGAGRHRAASGIFITGLMTAAVAFVIS